MFLMYIDESGDTGSVSNKSPTNYFILSAIIIHEKNWRQTLEELTMFRLKLRDTRGLKLSNEIHSADFINTPGELVRIKKNDRLDIIKKCIDWINSSTMIKVFSVVVDKRNKKEDIFNLAWKEILHQFEEQIANKTIPNFNSQDKGMILSDNTEGEKLRKLVRQMRHEGYTRNISVEFEEIQSQKLEYIIEDPIFRDSKISLLHQMNDVIAYCVRQKYETNAYMKKKGGHNYWRRLENVSLKHISDSENGIIDI
jgi:hypothetical protein